MEEARWGRKKAKTLIKILALENSHSLYRDRLMELLWPEQNSEQALNNLHKTIHAARRALEPELKAGGESRFMVTTDQQRVVLQATELRIDSEEFERAARRALADKQSSQGKQAEALEAAHQLYTGDLLPDDRLEDWASLKCEQFQNLHQEVVVALATNVGQQMGGSARAIEVLQEAVASQATNEIAHRHLIRLYASTGNRHLAMNQFRVCVDALKKELDVEPELATVRLFEEIKQGQGTLVEPTPVVREPRAEARFVESAAATSADNAGGLSRRAWWGVAGAGIVAISTALRRVLGTSKKDFRSLAVMPLQTKGAASLEYLSSGLTESLIGNLSRSPLLRVMARSTVYAFQDKSNDPRALGKAVGASAVLAGILSNSNDQIDVNLELVDVEDGARVWGNRYSFSIGELPLMEVRIAREVKEALGFSGKEQLDLVRRGTGNPQALQEYLQGRYQFNKRSEEAFGKAIVNFEKAIELDPGYALAYSGLADCYGLLGFSNRPPGENFPKARLMAQKALALDDELAEAHNSIAMVNALYEWNWKEAETEFRRAISLNPNLAVAHHWYAVHLNAQGRPVEAKEEFAKALLLDPLSRIILSNSGYVSHYQRDYAGAIATYKKVLELDANFGVAREDLVLAYEQSKQFDLALQLGLEGLKPQSAAKLAGLGKTSYASALAELRRDAEADGRKSYVSPMVFASFAVRLDETEAAFHWLDAALAKRSAPLVYLNVDPLYDPIRKDPRFAVLLKKIGL